MTQWIAETSIRGAPKAPFPMCFTASAAEEILRTIGSRPPETGAKLFGPKDHVGIDVVEFDIHGSQRAGGTVYSPDVQWGNRRVDHHLDQKDIRVWTGDGHSHPGSMGHPSGKSGVGLGDLGYVEQVFHMNEWMQYFCLPIFTFGEAGVRIHPWIICRDNPFVPLLAPEVRICPASEFPDRQYNPVWEARINRTALPQAKEASTAKPASAPAIAPRGASEEEASRLALDVTRVRDENARLQADIRRSNVEHERTSRDLRTAKAEITELQDRVVKAEKEAARALISQMSGQSEKTKMENLISQQRQEIGTLKGMITDLRSRHDQLADELSRLTREATKHGDGLRQLQDDVTRQFQQVVKSLSQLELGLLSNDGMLKSEAKAIRDGVGAIREFAEHGIEKVTEKFDRQARQIHWYGGIGLAAAAALLACFLALRQAPVAPAAKETGTPAQVVAVDTSSLESLRRDIATMSDKLARMEAATAERSAAVDGVSHALSVNRDELRTAMSMLTQQFEVIAEKLKEKPQKNQAGRKNP